MKLRTHTHTGECQICGRVQAVRPGSNLMAKHGYTVDWGCFRGTCWGADHLPLQLSKDLLDKAIQMSHETIANLNQSIQAERNADPMDGYVSVRIKGKGYAATRRTWMVACEFRDVTVPYASGDGTYNDVQALALRDNGITGILAGERVAYNAYMNGVMTAKAAALKSRESHITELQGEISQHERYIAWQERRKRDWTPRELTPVAAEPEQRVFESGDVLAWTVGTETTNITLTRPARGMRGQHTGWWAKIDGRDKEARFTTRELRAMTKPK